MVPGPGAGRLTALRQRRCSGQPQRNLGAGQGIHQLSTASAEAGLQQRHGGEVAEKHDAFATPHQRAVRHERMRKRLVIHMKAAFKKIKPRQSHATSWLWQPTWKPCHWQRSPPTFNQSPLEQLRSGGGISLGQEGVARY